jgi:hypothetical protein
VVEVWVWCGGGDVLFERTMAVCTDGSCVLIQPIASGPEKESIATKTIHHINKVILIYVF